MVVGGWWLTMNDGDRILNCKIPILKRLSTVLQHAGRSREGQPGRRPTYGEDSTIELFTSSFFFRLSTVAFQRLGRWRLTTPDDDHGERMVIRF